MSDYSDIKSTGGMDPRNSIDEAMYRLTLQQRDQAWREIQYWQQKCDAIRAQLDATIAAMSGLSALQINPPVKLLANAESYEAGRVMEREACAKVCDERKKEFEELFKKYGNESDAGAALGAGQCGLLIRSRSGQQ